MKQGSLGMLCYVTAPERQCLPNKIPDGREEARDLALELKVVRPETAQHLLILQRPLFEIVYERSGVEDVFSDWSFAEIQELNRGAQMRWR